MKKRILQFALLFSIVSFAQVTLEDTYLGDFSVIKLNKSGCKYVTQQAKYVNNESQGTQVKIYNLDNSLYKSFIYPVNAKLAHISQHIINDDDKLEYIYVSYNKFSRIRTYIENEDGTEIFTIDNYQPHGSATDYLTNNSSFIIATENGNKLILKSDSTEPIDGCDFCLISWSKQKVFSLGGSAKLSSNSLSPKSYKSYPYPVPSATIVNIDYVTNKGELTTIGVYDASGNQIETFTMDDKFDTLKLDVTNYASGVYVYQIENATGTTNGKFIVE